MSIKLEYPFQPGEQKQELENRFLLHPLRIVETPVHSQNCPQQILRVSMRIPHMHWPRQLGLYRARLPFLLRGMQSHCPSWTKVSLCYCGSRWGCLHAYALWPLRSSSSPSQVLAGPPLKQLQAPLVTQSWAAPFLAPLHSPPSRPALCPQCLNPISQRFDSSSSFCF